MQKNQEKIVEAIEFDPTKAITWEGKKLPALDWHHDEGEDADEDEGEGEGEGEEVKQAPKSLNIDKGITDEYINFLEDKNLPIPSEILKKSIDPDKIIQTVNQKIKRNNEYIESH